MFLPTYHQLEVWIFGTTEGNVPQAKLTRIQGTRKIEVSQSNNKITNEMSVRKLAVFASLSDDTLLELQPLVSELGLTAVFATDQEEALRLVDKDDPGLVVAEAGRRNVDAPELCARLRRESPNPNIPIILIGAAGGDGRENRLAALRAGADEFFAKPLDLEDTRLRLGALMRRTRLEQAPNDIEATTAVAKPPVVAQDPRPLYNALHDLVTGVLEQVKREQPLALDNLAEKAAPVVQSVGSSEQMISLALGDREAADLATHHVNVAILGVAIARELRLPERELERVALLGLVHDLGMVKVPESIRYAPRRLTGEELRVVAEHPGHTHQLLKAAGPKYHEIAEIAYQEHEREQGQGYPRGLKGEQIHNMAKIVGVADVYEACTHSRTYCKTFIPYDALQELIEMRGKKFNPRYIKAIMNALTVYPVGSYVQLNTGEIGRVQSTSRRNLMRPLVGLIWNERGQRFKSAKIVDLAESTFLFVSKPLYEEQLPRS